MDQLQLPFAQGADGASLRHTAGPLLAGWQTPDLVEDTLVVIAELVHNVLQHTDGGGELTISRHNGTVLIEVYDRSSHLPQAYPPDPRRIGGRGLLVVSALADGWGSHRTDTGKIVWARMPADQV